MLPYTPEVSHPGSRHNAARREFLFRLSISLKGVDAVLEIVGGIGLLLASPAFILRIGEFLIRDELAEDRRELVVPPFAQIRATIAVRPPARLTYGEAGTYCGNSNFPPFLRRSATLRAGSSHRDQALPGQPEHVERKSQIRGSTGLSELDRFLADRITPGVTLKVS